ncbi:hypothetical protein OIU77_029053 [Salix suchowensis]|uniref:Uncharacterized protein n=1 Tax=Salix suchowensis TaxID=1278906 RepID=A0ABQ9BK06_9ROSI|nr:hypothetical protein OIU77_029053 [Salix suchowensis]
MKFSIIFYCSLVNFLCMSYCILFELYSYKNTSVTGFYFAVALSCPMCWLVVQEIFLQVD